MSHASRETFDQIKAEGILSAMRQEVYEALWTHEHKRDIGLTHNEVSHHVAEANDFRPDYRNNTVARLCELEQMGAVARVGEITCPLSGFTATTWRTLNQMPHALPKKERVCVWLLLDPKQPEAVWAFLKKKEAVDYRRDRPWKLLYAVEAKEPKSKRKA